MWDTPNRVVQSESTSKKVGQLTSPTRPIRVAISPNKVGYVNKGMRRGPLKMYLTKERNHVKLPSDQSWYISLCMVYQIENNICFLT